MNKTQQFEANQAAMSDSELIELAHKEVCELARTYGKSHKMSIPPMVTDTDMLLCELINRFKESKKETIPDLSGATIEQRNMIIKELTETTAKAVLTVFMALGLKTHIETKVINEATGDEYFLQFNKIEK